MEFKTQCENCVHRQVCCLCGVNERLQKAVSAVTVVDGEKTVPITEYAYAFDVKITCKHYVQAATVGIR